MKKIIVFSLWGSDRTYWVGAQQNIELSRQFYPEFTCRFYIDNTCSKDLIESLDGDNVEKILMSPDEYNLKNSSIRFNHSGLFWRFLSLLEPDAVVLSRDCDSRISQREVDAVREWLNSDLDFHIMRDHPYHRVPILAGMWGARNGVLSNIDSLLSDWKSYPNKGRYQADDQDFLGTLIYPLIKENSLEHSEFGISYGGQTKPFPSKRLNYEFIGDVFDENNQRHPDYWRLIY